MYRISVYDYDVLEDQSCERFQMDLLKMNVSVEFARQSFHGFTCYGCLHLRKLYCQSSCKQYRNHSYESQPEYFERLFDDCSVFVV